MKKEKSHVELSTLEIKMPGQELLKHIYEHGQSAPYDITYVVAKSIIEHFLRTNEVLTLTYIDGKEYVLNIERVEDTKEPEPKKVYLSGPITSLPLEDAWAMFLRSEKHLRRYGYSVVNPMNNGLSPDSSWEEHMRKDIALLLDCDYICLLPNYRQSKGAMLELSIAIALQMTVINHSDDDPHVISLAQKHLNDTIEEPSRTLRQNMSDNLSKMREVLREIGEENLEALRILKGITPDKPASNVITNKPFIHPALLGKETAITVRRLSDIVCEPGEPLAYEMYQRRVEFLSNFENGRKLYNENALFHTITELIMRGANVYELLLELIFMQDGLCTPETSHLIDICNMDSPGADAPNKKI